MWKLIYDRKCEVVVMLSDLLEDGKVSYGVLNKLYNVAWVVGGYWNGKHIQLYS